CENFLGNSHLDPLPSEGGGEMRLGRLRLSERLRRKAVHPRATPRSHSKNSNATLAPVDCKVSAVLQPTPTTGAPRRATSKTSLPSPAQCSARRRKSVCLSIDRQRGTSPGRAETLLCRSAVE